MTANGIDVLLIVVGLILVFALAEFRAWAKRDRDRRQARRVHVNLMRAQGQWFS
jgi:Tfp pilus assembly protein FimT